MPSYTGRFEYVAPGKGAVEGAPCECSFDGETVTFVSSGAPTAFDLGDIDVFAVGEYELRLVLYTGNEVRLTHFGKAFQDLERELLEAYRDRLVTCLLVSDLDEVVRFPGRVQLDSPRRSCAGSAEVRLYESNIAVLPDDAVGFQWRLADIDAVEFNERDYAVTLTRGDERLSVSRLAKRTGELADRVRSRISALRERSARALRALFPFLSPDEFRQLASVMREGTSVAVKRLEGVHRLIEPVLMDKVVASALKPYLRALASRATPAGWYTGFKIIRKEAAEGSGEGSDEESAAGAGSPLPERDPAITDAGDGLEVLYWFYFPMAAQGGAVPSHVAWEATSRGGRATYVFRLDQRLPVDDSVGALNRGLVALNFRREAVYLKAEALESELRYRHYAIAARKVPDVAGVRGAFVGRAIHTSVAPWTEQLDNLVRGSTERP